MAFFQWNETYSVGVPKFDQEHKKLVDLINKFYDSMKAGKGRQAIEETCKELVDYAKTHFVHEELAMKTSDYPNLEEHIKQHEIFKSRVAALQGKLAAGESVNAINVGNFLKDWLTKHIMGTDKTYTPYLS